MEEGTKSSRGRRAAACRQPGWVLPATWENIRAGGGREHTKIRGFVLIIMQGRVDARLSLAFTNLCGPQASRLLLLLSDIRKRLQA